MRGTWWRWRGGGVMAQDNRFGIPGVPFPVGVEYYRPPTPKPEVWDEDFARLSAAGLRIVRSFPYWQWFEPSPGVYEMDDIDLLFDTAEKHGLYVWLDVPTATHGAGPDWLLRHYPDMQSSTTATSWSSRTRTRPMPRAPRSIASITPSFGAWRATSCGTPSTATRIGPTC